MKNPFDSTSPRFDYGKVERKMLEVPAPGFYQKHYEEEDQIKKFEIKTMGRVGKKYIPSLGIENREKHSLFG